MEKFIRLTARACPLDVTNLNTDQLLPARFLKLPRAAGLGTSLLRAFLIFNNRTKIIFCMSHLHYERRDFLREVFPDYNPQADVNGLRNGGSNPLRRCMTTFPLPFTCKYSKQPWSSTSRGGGCGF